jgi:hypothetical protein
MSTSTNVLVHEPFMSPGIAETTVLDPGPFRISANRRTFTSFVDVDALTFDVDALALTSDVASIDKSDPVRPFFDWTLEDGPLGSIVLTTLGGGGAVWGIMRPATVSGRMQLPEVPSALTAWLPDTTGSLSTQVGHVGLADPLSYEAMLQTGVSQLFRAPIENEDDPFPDYTITQDITTFPP